jgi:hypothetical protein
VRGATLIAVATELDDDELEQIERRSLSGTPGPWQAFVEGRDHHGGDDFIRTGDVDAEAPDMYIALYVGNQAVPVPPEDLDFIASAKQDVPRLVAEIHRLRQT